MSAERRRTSEKRVTFRFRARQSVLTVDGWMGHRCRLKKIRVPGRGNSIHSLSNCFPSLSGQADTADWGPLSSLPGNPMMWILILGELAVFGALFVGFAVARALDPVTFDASQAHLDGLLGGLNTMVLVTSGWLVAVAVQRRATNPNVRTAATGRPCLARWRLARCSSPSRSWNTPTRSARASA